MDNLLWTEKYKPKNLRNLIGNKKKIKIIREWIENFKNKVPGTKKVLLISGEPGLGKTTTAHLLLKEYGFDVIEHNSSDIRGKKNMLSVLKRSIEFTNIIDIFNNNQKPIGIVMDEIDNLCMGGSDRGGFSTFLNIIKEDIDFVNNKNKTKKKIIIYNPIICTYNNFSDKKLTELKKYAEHIVFSKPNNIEIAKFINNICKKENLEIDNDAIALLTKYCNYDIRRLLNLLENIKSKTNKGKITLEKIELLKEFFNKKNKDFYLIPTIQRIFNENIDITEAIELFKNETFKIPLFIHENIIEFINSTKSINYDKIEILSKVFEIICKNDKLQTWIYNNQEWIFFEYSAIYSIIIPNHLLSKLKKSIFKNRILFSSILNKISQKHTNKKLLLNTKIKLKNINAKLNNKKLIFLSELFYYHLFHDKGDLDSLANYMIQKNIKIEDIDSIIKIKKFNNIKIVKLKLFSSKLKKILKKKILTK